MNRSMEAHFQMAKAGLKVRSFGTGAQVRLPGPSQDKPNVYEFGTAYSYILKDLRRKDEHLYKQNGLIYMLERNVTVKTAPERWHDMDKKEAFDVVFTYEARVFDGVLQELQGRESETFWGVHVINLETKDNHEEAVISAKLTVKLCEMLEGLEDLERDIVRVCDEFQAATKRPLIYSLVYI
eukprot:CAMPEP_0206252892 /NCGR_PEP_ID=MMETSP0047_2-20121206/22858_1 /ASSEMBLY_ACC=CAM_ASM_000192 /TAXON_ID=195065 /ORGANISM="Chroomonas mesostigmatica_cf, Strain CCMP1168" /LENGTH=181 /DNA_ID=CAMNT_0053679059 /DNA_START=14 /DNA_END=559 /DNA_ORIENTATION=-